MYTIQSFRYLCLFPIRLSALHEKYQELDFCSTIHTQQEYSGQMMMTRIISLEKIYVLYGPEHHTVHHTVHCSGLKSKWTSGRLTEQSCSMLSFVEKIINFHDCVFQAISRSKDYPWALVGRWGFLHRQAPAIASFNPRILET